MTLRNLMVLAVLAIALSGCTSMSNDAATDYPSNAGDTGSGGCH